MYQPIRTHSPIPRRFIETLRKISAIPVLLRCRRWLSVIPLVAIALAAPLRAQTGNVGYGTGALDEVTTGDDNTAIGWYALTNDNTGTYNTASGAYSLYYNLDGNYNTAFGVYSLFQNTNGDYNTASGSFSLQSNTTGHSNTATGHYALHTNGTGYANTATGLRALQSNINGRFSTATGAYALYSYKGGGVNTATGYLALYSNETGTFNTATGNLALQINKTGSYNTATGANALQSGNTGSSNTASGYQALQFVTGSNNIGIGANAGANLTTGDNNIAIANTGLAADAAKIRIGTKGTHTTTFIAGISGKTVPNGTGVFINGNGQLGTILSSARFKEAVQPMNQASEAVLKLEPVTFRYKEELDSEGIPQFGLIAEQVEKVNPDLVVRDEDGKVTTVRYDAVNAMLLNEFLKEHRRAEEQRKQFEAKFAQQQQQIEALTTGLQKVNRQVGMNKPTPRVATRR